MKWFQIAQFVLPLAALIPGAAPLIPFISAGINEAQQIHGDSNNAEKQQHVLNVVAAGAAAVSATGKVSIDPTEAQAVTNAVFSTINSVQAMVKQNQQTIADAPQTPAIPSVPAM